MSLIQTSCKYMLVGTEVLIFESMRYKCHVIELSD